ncbi:MAG: TetR/AcrR family transcriptional regulator [Flavobacteriales bacterium]
MVKKESAEEKILAAARRVFRQKGMGGSRMQEIAEEAGINKALLHYYFRSKEKLFLAVFRESFELLVPRLNALLQADLPLFDKIRELVGRYSEFLAQHPYLPAFIIYEMNADTQRFVAELQASGCLPAPQPFLKQVETSVQKGEICPVEPAQLLINIIALCVFPFAVMPMLQAVELATSSTVKEMLDKRQTEVAEFIINAIRP